MIWSSYSFALLIVLGSQCGYSKNQAVDESGRMFFFMKYPRFPFNLKNGATITYTPIKIQEKMAENCDFKTI